MPKILYFSYLNKIIMKNYSTKLELSLLLESALESSLAGFWDWNMISNVEYLSPRFKEMLGYKVDEMANTPEAWQKIAYQEDLPAMFECFERHVSSKGAIPFNSVVRYYHKDGSTIWVRCNGKVVEWSDSGEPIRAIGCHVDITEEKNNEINLKRAIAEKEILLAEVHHRVKNNLQLLLSMSRMQQKEGFIRYQDMEDTISSIAFAYEAIYKVKNLDGIKLSNYLKNVITPILINSEIKLIIKASQNKMTISKLIPVGLIIIECVNNSLKHAFQKNKKKEIVIEIYENKNKTELIYKDNGVGYNEELLQLSESPSSFGLTIIKLLSEQIDAKLQFSNDNGAKLHLIV
jgi:two-component system CheB/CheR fusion protein